MMLVETTFPGDFEKHFIKYIPGPPDMTYVKSCFDARG